MSSGPIDLDAVVRDVDHELAGLGDTSPDEGYYRAELLSLRAAAALPPG